MPLNMKRKSDVCVIGGGPSGLRAAALLAESGFHVRVLERKPRVGANITCTGIVGKHVFDAYTLDRRSILGELQDVRLVSPRGTSLTYHHPSPFAYVVDRERFDRFLAGEALAKGVDIQLKTRVEDIRVEENGVSLRAQIATGEKLDYSAGIAVIASGNDFSLHRRLGLGHPKDFLVGGQAEMEIPGETVTTIFVGRGVAPGAFAWAVPAEAGKVRVGMLTRQDPRPFLLNLIEKAYPGKGECQDSGRIKVKAIAQGLLSRTFGDRILTLGEAAGQVKTTTGGGIYYGLLCAGIAADVIKNAFREGSFSSASLAGYEKKWKGAIQKEIVLGHWARRMGARLTDSQMEKIFYLAQTDGIIPIIREKGDFDWHSDLVLALLRRVSFLRFFKEPPEDSWMENAS